MACISSAGDTRSTWLGRARRRRGCIRAVSLSDARAAFGEVMARCLKRQQPDANDEMLKREHEKAFRAPTIVVASASAGSPSAVAAPPEVSPGRPGMTHYPKPMVRSRSGATTGASAGSGFNFRFPWASWIVRSTFNRSQPSSIPGVSR